MAATTEDGPSFSTLIVQLLDNLWSTDYVINLVKKKKLDHMFLQRLENIVCAVEEVLHDAEHQQMENPAVKKWLDYIKDAVNVADGLLNQIATKTEPSEEVSNFKDIIPILESILEQKDFLGLQHISRENSSRNTPTSLAEGCNIYGRDEDKEAIIKLLLDDSSDDNISVISIVGMGGVGKTTLTQMVYNDDNLKQKFDLKAWVCVSEEFDILKITQNIIKAVTSSPCNNKDLHLLQVDLKEMLSRKKFLLVLDDIWDADYDSWDILLRPFQYGMKGSKILITTRSQSVTNLVQSSETRHLQPLSEEDWWLIFAKRSSLSSRFSTREKISRKIAHKCHGSPIAAQLIGGLLQTKHNIKDWNIILNTDGWKFSKDRSDSFPASKICYDYLPAHLKRCLASCSSYPYSYKFNKDELISLWMAQGLLQSSNSEKTSEEIGDEYFHDLVSRSFLQQFSIDGSCKSFVMPRSIYFLASFEANELRTFLPLDFKEDLSTRIPSTSRGTGWIQIRPFPSFTLPTIASLSTIQYQWMISIRIRNVRLRVELWRLMGFVSGIIGMFCLALSPSFTHLVRGWDSFKFFLYGVVIFIICITAMFAKKRTLSRHSMLKANMGFAVLILTSLYSFWHDKAMNGKADVWSTISNGAFALMSLSLSRVLKIRSEVGLFAFFLGSFVIQLATIKLVLIPIGIIYGLPLFLIHSYSNADSDYPPSVRTLDD